MAKKKSAKKSNLLAPVLRGIGWLWRLIAKTLGGMVRFIFRSSKELDPAHQRDGIAFFLFILAIISAAGVWFDLDNLIIDVTLGTNKSSNLVFDFSDILCENVMIILLVIT